MLNSPLSLQPFNEMFIMPMLIARRDVFVSAAIVGVAAMVAYPTNGGLGTVRCSTPPPSLAYTNIYASPYVTSSGKLYKTSATVSKRYPKRLSSAELKALTPSEIHEIVEDIFQRFSLPQGLATAMVIYESTSCTRMTSKTGAKGCFQFTKRTAKQYGLKNRMELVSSAIASAKLAKANKRVLGKAGVPATRLNLYLAHMIGGSGTSYLYKLLAKEKLTRKQLRTLERVIKPQWIVAHMGKWEGSLSSRSRRFIARTAYKFDQVLQQGKV